MRATIVLMLLLGGCAYTVQKTAIAPVGPDTYQVGATAGRYVGGVTEARTVALQEAARFCGDRPMSALAVEPAGDRATVTFRCEALSSVPAPTTTVNVNLNRDRP